MNNQKNDSFDLIILDNDIYEQTMLDLNNNYKMGNIVDVSWELKLKPLSFKVYNNAKIVKIEKNTNPFTKKIQGYVISFSCENNKYYSNNLIGHVEKTKVEIWENSLLLDRSIKLSHLILNSDNGEK